jgi:hypothetical protein
MNVVTTKTSVVPKNTFFDISRLPTTEGIFFLGISMSRIGNAQSPQKCIEYVRHLASKIQYTAGIGCELWYGDYLYLHTDEPAGLLRDRFKEDMISHKNGFMRLLQKDRVWTHKAFSFKTFGQILLENSDIYPLSYSAVKTLYKSDLRFRQYVHKDCTRVGQSIGERAVNFILEEIAMFYLSQKGAFRLNNKFITDTEKTWTLQAYPGKPLSSEVYLFQANPLKLSNPKNMYENCYYDLESKLLYDYTRLDLETFDLFS